MYPRNMACFRYITVNNTIIIIIIIIIINGKYCSGKLEA
jgi:hypothetical protein